MKRRPRISEVLKDSTVERKLKIISSFSPTEEIKLFDRILNEKSTFTDLKSSGFSSDYAQFVDYLGYRKLLHVYENNLDSKVQSSYTPTRPECSPSSPIVFDPSPMSVYSCSSSSRFSSASTAEQVFAPSPNQFLSSEQEWIKKLRLKINNAINASVEYKDLEPFELLETKKSTKKDNFPPLTSDIVKKVAAAFKSTSGVIASKFNIDIEADDIKRLQDGQWLNDELINFYGNLVMERSTQRPDMLNIHFFNTFFYSHLKKEGYTKVKRWTKKFDLFAKDLVIFPVHLHVHWCCGVIDFREKVIEYYDSMHGCDTSFFTLVRGYLKQESLDKKKIEFDFTNWKDVIPKNIPAQENGYDCGVFSCMFGEYRSRNEPFDFSQQHMKYFRKKMAYEIITGKLLLY